MATVKYIGADDSINVFGHTFINGESRSKLTMSEDEIARLFYNPQFEVSDWEPASKEPVISAADRKAADKEEAATVAKLHKGDDKQEPFVSKAEGAHGADKSEPVNDPNVVVVKVEGNMPTDKPAVASPATA